MPGGNPNTTLPAAHSLKSNPVTSDANARSSYCSPSLSLSQPLRVFLCQGLSIARSSRRVTWHKAVSGLTRAHIHTHTRRHTHSRTVHPEGMFRCWRPATEGVRGLHSLLLTDLYPAMPPTSQHGHTQAHSPSHSPKIYTVHAHKHRMNSFWTPLYANMHILISLTHTHTLPAVVGHHKADCV